MKIIEPTLTTFYGASVDCYENSGNQFRYGQREKNCAFSTPDNES